MRVKLRVNVCYVKKVEEIGLKRGRCHHCLKMKNAHRVAGAHYYAV